MSAPEALKMGDRGVLFLTYCFVSDLQVLTYKRFLPATAPVERGQGASIPGLI